MIALPPYLPPPMVTVMYAAQVYGCDAYGAVGYSDCPTAPSDPNASTNSQSTTPGSEHQTTNQATHGSALSEDSPVSDSGQDNDPLPGTNTTNPAGDNRESNPIDTIADTSWSVIIPLALLAAILIALIILFIKRRKRNDDARFDPPTQPSGPSNPFLTGR